MAEEIKVEDRICMECGKYMPNCKCTYPTVRAEPDPDKLEPERCETLPPEMSLYRIEALRAASRIVAGALAGGNPPSSDMEQATENTTVRLAEQFAKWLEKGER